VVARLPSQPCAGWDRHGRGHGAPARCGSDPETCTDGWNTCRCDRDSCRHTKERNRDYCANHCSNAHAVAGPGPDSGSDKRFGVLRTEACQKSSTSPTAHVSVSVEYGRSTWNKIHGVSRHSV
jgi:hypothetical protein